MLIYFKNVIFSLKNMGKAFKYSNTIRERQREREREREKDSKEVSDLLGIGAEKEKGLYTICR